MKRIGENCMENNTEEYCRRAPLGTLFFSSSFLLQPYAGSLSTFSGFYDGLNAIFEAEKTIRSTQSCLFSLLASI